MTDLHQPIVTLLLNYWQGIMLTDPQAAVSCDALAERVLEHLSAEQKALLDSDPHAGAPHVLTVLNYLARRDPQAQSWIKDLQRLSNPSPQSNDRPTHKVEQHTRGRNNLVAANDVFIGMPAPSPSGSRAAGNNKPNKEIKQTSDGEDNTITANDLHVSGEAWLARTAQSPVSSAQHTLTGKAKTRQTPRSPSLLPVMLRFSQTGPLVRVGWESRLDSQTEFVFELPCAAHWPLLNKALAVLQELSAEQIQAEAEAVFNGLLSGEEYQTLLSITSLDAEQLGQALPRWIGETLHEALTHQAQAALLFERMQHSAQQHTVSYLLQFVPSAAHLNNLPWELLWAADGPVLINAGRSVSISRVLGYEPERPPHPQNSRAVHVVALVPQQSKLPTTLLHEEQRARLLAWQDAAKQGKVVLHQFASIQELQQYAEHGLPLDILHFYGYAQFANGQASILLDDQNAAKRWLAAEEARPWLSATRLVVLHATQDTQHDEQDTLTNVAKAWSQLGIPAVIALRSALASTAGNLFINQLYACLAAGQNVEQALLQARLVLHAANPRLHWYVPLLLLSTAEATQLQIVS